jgi:hypothetical protein
MKTLFEGRLDNTVDAGTIGIGERVDIRTKMGEHVATGDVIANNPFGIFLKEHGFFDRDLYLFAPLEENPALRPSNMLVSSPDDRVAERLRRAGEDVPIYEADKLDDKGDDGKDKKDTDDGGKSTEVDKDKKPDDDEKKPIAKPDSSVDVSNLPDDIKKAVISTTQMNEDQLNSVMSEIGDATVKSLKRAGVKDTEIYGVASKVQHAIHKILTGSSPFSLSSRKKN